MSMYNSLLQYVLCVCVCGGGGGGVEWRGGGGVEGEGYSSHRR